MKAVTVVSLGFDNKAAKLFGQTDCFLRLVVFLLPFLYYFCGCTLMFCSLFFFGKFMREQGFYSTSINNYYEYCVFEGRPIDYYESLFSGRQLIFVPECLIKSNLRKF